MAADSRPPEQFVADAAELGFTIGGWDDTTAGIFGNDTEFVGSHAEVEAFLRGWIAYMARGVGDVQRQLLSLRTLLPRHQQTIAGTSFQVISHPQRCFIGERIALTEQTARCLAIVDVLVGNRSQFVRAGSFDGELFATRISQLPHFLFDACLSGSHPGVPK